MEKGVADAIEQKFLRVISHPDPSLTQKKTLIFLSRPELDPNVKKFLDPTRSVSVSATKAIAHSQPTLYLSLTACGLNERSHEKTGLNIFQKCKQRRNYAI
jgi:hypothetical protein